MQIAQEFGVVKVAITDEQEARAVAAAKQVLVNQRYFGTAEPAISSVRYDDLASDQVAGGHPMPEGKP